MACGLSFGKRQRFTYPIRFSRTWIHYVELDPRAFPKNLNFLESQCPCGRLFLLVAAGVAVFPTMSDNKYRFDQMAESCMMLLHRLLGAQIIYS